MSTDIQQSWESPSGKFRLERISGTEIDLIGNGHRTTFEWGDQAYALFGELLSSANKSSAAEAELRAEVEMARHSLHDIQKPGALNHFASRWDQINGILGAAGIEPDPDNWVNDVHTLVTERDQLRDENSALIEKCAQACEAEAVEPDGTAAEEDRAYNMAITHAAAAIRALKSNRATVSESPKSIEPIPGTAAALAKLTIRGG